MVIVLDRKEDKNLSQLCSFLDIPMRRADHRNGNDLLELMLGCIDASSLAEEYGYLFNPYKFNRSYRNHNPIKVKYNSMLPQWGCLNLGR